MKLGNFGLAQRLVEARLKLTQQRDQLSLGVTLGGQYQDDEMVERVRPTVVAVLNERIGELDKDLKQLGVDVG